MPRSPLTEQYQRVMSLVDQLHQLPEDERNFVLDLFAPLPTEPEKSAAKKSKKKSTKSAGRSPRAAGISAQLNRRVEEGRRAMSSDHCFATVDDNGGEMTCGKPENDSVHDLTYSSSHPFARDARDAERRSSPNDAPPATENGTRKPASSSKSDSHGQETGAGSSVASSEVGVVNVSSATGD